MAKKKKNDALLKPTVYLNKIRGTRYINNQGGIALVGSGLLVIVPLFHDVWQSNQWLHVCSLIKVLQLDNNYVIINSIWFTVNDLSER